MCRCAICLLSVFIIAVFSTPIVVAQDIGPVGIDDSTSLVEHEISTAYSNFQMDQPACSDYTGELSCYPASKFSLNTYEDSSVANCKQKADFCECNAQFTAVGECFVDIASKVTETCPHGCVSGFRFNTPLLDCLGSLFYSDPKMVDEIGDTAPKPVSHPMVIDPPFRFMGKCGGKIPGLDTFIKDWIKNNPATLQKVLAKNYCDAWFAELPNKLASYSWPADFACKGELSYSDRAINRNNN